MKKAKKIITLVAAMVLLVCVSVMGTLAYLTSQQEVTNTFTVGEVAITLDETEIKDDGLTADDTVDRVTSNEYHLIPGREYVKDPIIHIGDKSEACYVFVKLENELINIIDTENTLETQMTDKGWSLVTGYTNIYKKAAAVDANANIEVFDKLVIGTAADIVGYEEKEIKITACAIQADGFVDVDAAAAALPTEFTAGAITE